MAKLGELFIREICYGVHLRDGLLETALYEVEGEPAGFVAYTPRSITFHRQGLEKHWFYASWITLISLLQDPRRLLHLLRALRVVFSRRTEHEREQDPLGEVVCMAVRRQYLTSDFVGRTGLRISRELVAHASDRLRRDGVDKMRMLVDVWNKSVLFLYHSLGAHFESYTQAGEPMVQVWFDLTGGDSKSPDLT